MANKYYANNPYESSGSGNVSNNYQGNKSPFSLNSSGINASSIGNFIQGLSNMTNSYGVDNYNPIDQYPSINSGSLYLDPNAKRIYDYNTSNVKNIGTKSGLQGSTESTVGTGLAVWNPFIGALYGIGTGISDSVLKGNEDKALNQSLSTLFHPSGAVIQGIEEKKPLEVATALTGLFPLTGALRAKRVRKERMEAKRKAENQYKKYLNSYNSSLENQALFRGNEYASSDMSGNY